LFSNLEAVVHTNEAMVHTVEAMFHTTKFEEVVVIVL
jgi:hypothetical protein